MAKNRESIHSSACDNVKFRRIRRGDAHASDLEVRIVTVIDMSTFDEEWLSSSPSSTLIHQQVR